jgi:hypothetical protein
LLKGPDTPIEYSKDVEMTDVAADVSSIFNYCFSWNSHLTSVNLNTFNKIFESQIIMRRKKTNGPKQNSQHWLRLNVSSS